MAELSIENLTLTFGGPPLLDGVEVQVEEGERLGLLGRNGSGKSTLLSLMRGSLQPDEGRVVRRRDLTLGSLEQEVPRDLKGTVRNVVAAALTETPEWEVEKRTDRTLLQLGLNPDAQVADLSAGNQRRVLLARALARDPDLLLLDEPTNHLDIEAIAGLEDLLLHRAGTLIFVTHDRAFLRSVATGILDLDRGKIVRHEGSDLEKFIERKEAALEAEAKQAAQFDKKLAQEEAWLRRGIKARRTRNMGRVRALREMRSVRQDRREVVGTAKAGLQAANRSGELVFQAEGLTHSFGEHRVLAPLDLEIRRGDRVGIVGANGCGKTTLLRLLLGEVQPTGGTVKRGTKLMVGRFDQLHDSLDLDATLQENLCPKGGDHVMVGDSERHVMGYLGDFLFTPDQVRTPVSRLSGGERNRLQLALLLAQPCNLLVLDEPTNDLDLETLELLEGLLLAFDGTLLVVSHDRDFLDNSVTSLLVSEAEGRWHEVVGGWTDYQREAKVRAGALEPGKKESAGSSASRGGGPKGRSTRSADGAAASGAKVKKLTFTQEHELKSLPAKIEDLEARKVDVEKIMSAPNFYASVADPGGPERIARTTKDLEHITSELTALYERWEELDSLAEANSE